MSTQELRVDLTDIFGVLRIGACKEYEDALHSMLKIGRLEKDGSLVYYTRTQDDDAYLVHRTYDLGKGVWERDATWNDREIIRSRFAAIGLSQRCGLEPTCWEWLWGRDVLAEFVKVES